MSVKYDYSKGAWARVRLVLLIVLVTTSMLRVDSAMADNDLPDLVITNVTATLVSGSLTEYDIAVTVKNEGGNFYEDCQGPGEGEDCVADQIYRDIFVDSAPQGACPPKGDYYDIGRPPIASGASDTQTIRVSNLSAGLHDLYVYVDVNCAVDETNNDNNFYDNNNTYGPITIQVGGKIDVTIGEDSMGSYYLRKGEEKRENYATSGGPVKVESNNDTDVVAAIRLQSYANNTLYSFVETMGVPEGSLSSKYYFPTYNNTWGPLNSQLRFGNLNSTDIKVKVTIGTDSWIYPVAANGERREYLPVSGGPVIIESVDPVTEQSTPDKKIVAAIRLQSFTNNTLYSFSETMGIPVEQLSSKYYFPTYNNTWGPLNSQLRFGNLNGTAIKVRVTIGTDSWTYDVGANAERREYLAVSGGPVIIESVDANGNPTPDKKIIAAIRLQSYANNALYSFTETMGIPDGSLSSKYYFPTYNNTWEPLNSQLRFGNLNGTAIKVKVTIGTNSWTYDVPANAERREYLVVSGGPVIIESVDADGNPMPDKKIVAAIRLQSFANNTLYSFSETMGIPVEKISDIYYFPTYNNTWIPLNSQLRFGIP